MNIDLIRLLYGGYVTVLLLGSWYAYRRFKSAVLRARERDKSTRWQCPKCDSPDVHQLPGNEISLYPGFVCRECGIRMRSTRSTVLYVAALVLGIGLLAIPIASLWVGHEILSSLLHLLKFLEIGGVVAVYAAWQLTRPTPRPADPPPTDNPWPP